MPSILVQVAAVMAGIAGMGPVNGAGSAGGDHPIRLDVQEAPGRVLLKVVGKSDTPVDARYTLTVAARGQGGTNQSSQGGEVQLVPGREVTVIDLSVASGRDASWTAVLKVTRAGGAAYTIQRRSGAEAG